MARPRIFTTNFFYDQYEAAARRNLEWSVRQLVQ